MLSSAPRLAVAVLLLLIGSGAAAPLRAQMLGVPVLQNGFSNPGITAAINYGTADSRAPGHRRAAGSR
jgi:hypothetical protein